MRKRLATFCALSLAGVTAIAAQPAASPGSPASVPGQARPPNIILILIDDMGWRDCGFTGNKFIETPAIDEMARRGMRFTQAYAAAPNCAPTRACLMTGRYTPRHGVYTVSDPRQKPGSPWQKLLASESREEMPTEEVTVAETLRDRGYATAMFGMWNLGRGGKNKAGPCTPLGQGFEVFKDPKDVGFEKDAYRDASGRQLAEVFTDEGIAFMKSRGDKPFFLYLPYHDIHAPFDPPAELLKKYKAKAASLPADPANDPAYAATVENLDRNIARLTASLREQGLERDTVIVFTSDNGATKPFCAPMRGGKGELYEGGIRVPLFVVAPGVTVPGGECREPVASIDFHATLAELAGATPKATLDGRSLVPLLRGKTWPARSMFWHFPCYIGSSKPSSAIRSGDWKLMEFFEDRRTELYNLAKDAGESTDLAAREPARAKAMLAELHRWQKDTGAAIPSVANPAYDPAAKRPRGERGGRSANTAGGSKS